MNSYFKIWNLVALLCFVSLYGEEALYEFTGQHLMASYLDCNQQALEDLDTLERVMKEAAAASGATILSSSKHIFPPHGMTMVILLSESHASIHTYPEHRACFVDFFTCGHSCDASKFDAALIKYLQPQQANRQMFLRDRGMITQIY